MAEIRLRFDGGPSHADRPRFKRAELVTGMPVEFGVWEQDADGGWFLKLTSEELSRLAELGRPAPPPVPDDGRPRLAIDFEGAVRHPDTGAPVAELATAQSAVSWVVQLMQTWQVVLVTEQARTPEGENELRYWLRQHGMTREQVAEVAFLRSRPEKVTFVSADAVRFEGHFPTAAALSQMSPWHAQGVVDGSAG